MFVIPDAVTSFLYIAGAAGSAGVAAWIYPRREHLASAGGAVVSALVLSAIWCVVALSGGGVDSAGALAFSVAYLAWLVALYRLFAIDGRDESLKPIRPVIAVLLSLEVMQIALALAGPVLVYDESTRLLAFSLLALFRLLVAVGALVLVHNLYVGASASARKSLRWPASALALMWGYDLNFYTLSYISADIPASLAALRGAIPMAMAALIAPGATHKARELKLSPSRAATFQSISLVVIGGYLVAMIAIARWLAYFGGDFARTMQLAFVVSATVFALVFLPSSRLRGWLRVTLSKHLFQHRYDYREEWLRFTGTIGRGGEVALPLHERVVHAVADITGSPGGILLTAGEGEALELAARWNWKTLEVPGQAFPARQAHFFAEQDFIVDLDAMRSGVSQQDVRTHVPQWLLDADRAWALVPLVHFTRLTGMVVLLRPPQARRLDWEDFDLLKVAGRQLASYLAENEGQQALGEARQFDEFNRRMAFVMHDIKNLASQLGLLARNAEKHAENAEFRQDMLVTLRSSADKLNALLARLGRYNAGEMSETTPVHLNELLDQLRRRFNTQHPVELTARAKVAVQADRHALEQVVAHLLQNAIDASVDKVPVVLRLDRDAMHGVIEVVDTGTGMSPEFVRKGLFKPFVSSKPGGFGIGAYEARELVRTMRGQLEVESREGLGSRFTVRLPLAEITELYDQIERKSAAGAA